jgi:hypothetical protein
MRNPSYLYCCLDGLPAIVDENYGGPAYVFDRGAWREIHHAEVCCKAAIVAPEAFAAMFPHLPPLPDRDDDGMS